MPLTIHERCQPDGVAEFRAAAAARFEDGVLLSQGSPDRWLAAIYLWGYSTEMVLKSAVFNLIGYTPVTAVLMDDLKATKQLAADSGVAWSKKDGYHRFDLWSLMLVRWRVQLTGQAYPDPAMAGEVIARARRVYGWWRETLRYHVVAVRPAELAEARRQAEWFMHRADML